MYEADRTRIFERKKHFLQLLACRAGIQLNNFPNFVAVADEMALDFENFRDTLTGNFPTELTAEQASCLDSLDRSLSELNKEAWSNGAVVDPSEYCNIRYLSARDLREFGWPLEEPPLHGDEFVRGMKVRRQKQADVQAVLSAQRGRA
jgi:hypothetical protein